MLSEAEDSGHIEGSVLIPLRDLADNLAYLPSFDTHDRVLLRQRLALHHRSDRSGSDGLGRCKGPQGRQLWRLDGS